jgi:ribosomal protein S18 acetylase RimI-like enzyme
MRRAEECASELGATEVALDTWAFNTAAQAFFTALGYYVYNYRLRKGLGE